MKLLEIEYCNICPFLKWESEFEEWYCIKHNRMRRDHIIPEWCDLPDAPESEDK